jgi:hypothetical protein
VGGLLIGGSPPSVTLHVSKNGTGSGAVVSSGPAGIDCGSTCSFDGGASVTLTAVPSSGSRFAGWSGGGCTGTGSCVVNTGISEQTITAMFVRTVKIEISKRGKGSGLVSSRPAGIQCGATCSASFDAGTSVTLTATPSRGSVFAGWSGRGCKVGRSCLLSDITGARALTATFHLLPKCVVPKVEGKPLKVAKRSIRTHNCAVGRIRHAASRTIKKGHVISQGRKAGRRLGHGAKISLVISRGRR